MNILLTFLCCLGACTLLFLAYKLCLLLLIKPQKTVAIFGKTHDELQAIIESELRFRAMAENSPMSIWRLDKNKAGVYYNTNMLNFLGFRSLEEAIATGWKERVHPEDLPPLLDILETAYTNESNFESTIRIKKFDGDYRWLRSYGVLEKDENGDLKGYIGTSQDITTEKNYNEELEKKVQDRTQELAKNVRLLNSIVENVPAMVFLKDAKELKFQLFNKAAEETIGYSAEELLGKNDFDFFPKEQADFFTQIDHDVLSGAKKVDIREEKIQTKDGELRYLHTKKVPILDETGSPKYLLGISEDITEAKRNQEQIAILNQQLNEQVINLNALNKELEAFSYSVSHDLRAPLRAIDGFSQATIESAWEKLNDEERDYLSRVRKSSQHMSQLIDDMLKLARLSRINLTREAIDLSEMAEHILETLQDQDMGRNVQINIAPSLELTGDPGLIEVLMQNLLGNAWKFSSKKALGIIEVGRYFQGDTPVFYVKDNGAGFDMAYADKLFGVFQRLHKSSEFEGSGVGLATVQRIARLHGGQVWAEGSIGHGATFCFTMKEVTSVPNSMASSTTPQSGQPIEVQDCLQT